MQRLPISEVRSDLEKKFSKNRITILVGETGSGKSTQVPQFISSLNNGKERIAVTQPRRVAAINLAKRVAEETKTTLGQDVGYSVRFQNMSSPKTKIKYLTDGMLLRELLLNTNLDQYTTIILDEAHERTIVTDLLMGFLKTLLRKRNDLRLIVMSATLDADKFRRFFDGAEVLYVQGRRFPVQRYYLPRPVEDIVDATVRTAIQIHTGEPMGDILAFLAGQEDIDKAVDLLNDITENLPKGVPELVALPLYAALPQQQQLKVFEKVPGNKRKIILATNIAETSLTISGVRFVIDGGTHKVKVWRHDLGLDSLLTMPISKSNASQRMGRAGREAAGKCYRLYTENDYHGLRSQSEPEIERCDVAFPILTLKLAGVTDVLGWNWLERPSKGAILSALTQLYVLKALDDEGQITDLGKKMAVLPLPPHLSAALLDAHRKGISDPVLDIVSCLSIENLIMNPHPDKRDEVNEKRLPFITASGGMGDLIVLRNYVQHYRSLLSSEDRKVWCKELYINYRAMSNVEDIRKQLEIYLKAGNGSSQPGDIGDQFGPSTLNEQIIQCFLKGFVANTALSLPGRTYRTIAGGHTINIHPSSSVFGKKVDAIMYTEYIFTTKAYARNVSPIDLEWLQRIAPHFLSRRTAANDF
ncbi:P-loop containing nucleoside triphosphate hydrolase protein [Lipomyces tetrasporus]|uniref:RNA helicase n=1 Tax=Lipomyces tetrasporus TaxID=54092 RepID=A0AAD7QZT0_9ASCO|nr:P-loop containing nucleoside triphosphate hydrolase protein [Lipomyces tetrasporus]KAJ8104163.1 P-loop containing nucleoside triphosphate hydrolase protein [Lipomyces tetrasporus]